MRAGRACARGDDEKGGPCSPPSELTPNSFSRNPMESSMRRVTSSARLPGWEGSHFRLAAPMRWHPSKRS